MDNKENVKIVIKRNIGGTFTVSISENVFTYGLNAVLETRKKMKKDFEGITQIIEIARSQTSFDNENYDK